MIRNILTLAMLMTATILNAQIDLHSHAITDDYINFVKANGAEMDEGFPIPSWNVESHIAFMDKAGIKTSVLTMPAPQPFLATQRLLQRFAENSTRNVPH
jgi:hypothetical protein